MQQPTYTFPAPIVSSRPPMSSHYAPYNPRTTSQTTSTRSTTEFKGSTNPSEDWTKISDLAERRRIQNRIAQRNYRKKLKRRLEDLERRAHSRSISPNGEETDGRSTRESSTEQLQNQTSAATTTTTMTSTAGLDSSSIAPVTTTGYEYTAPAYTTSSSSTPYPSQYRTASSMASTYASIPATYVSSLDYSQAPSSQYIYAYDSTPAQTTSQTDMSVIDPSFILPLPSMQSASSSSRVPGVMRTGGIYDMDSSAGTIAPYYLSNTYDLQDQYFSAGVSSNYYNLDNLSPLPPLQYATSQRN